MPSHRKDPTVAPRQDRSVEVDWARKLGVPLLLLVPLAMLVFVQDEGWSAAVDPLVRISFIYFFLMVALRIMGKRELSEMSPFELITLLMVPEIFSSALSTKDYSLTQATVGVATLFVLVFITGLVTFRSRRLEKIIEGEPAILVDNGTLVERNLKRERVTADEVLSEVHKIGLADMDQVRWAILEMDGKISVIPKSPQGVPHQDVKKKA